MNALVVLLILFIGAYVVLVTIAFFRIATGQASKVRRLSIASFLVGLCVTGLFIGASVVGK